jgi:hypothetical protein
LYLRDPNLRTKLSLRHVEVDLACCVLTSSSCNFFSIGVSRADKKNPAFSSFLIVFSFRTYPCEQCSTSARGVHPICTWTFFAIYYFRIWPTSASHVASRPLLSPLRLDITRLMCLIFPPHAPFFFVQDRSFSKLLKFLHRIQEGPSVCVFRYSRHEGLPGRRREKKLYARYSFSFWERFFFCSLFFFPQGATLVTAQQCRTVRVVSSWNRHRAVRQRVVLRGFFFEMMPIASQFGTILYVKTDDLFCERQGRS